MSDETHVPQLVMTARVDPAPQQVTDAVASLSAACAAWPKVPVKNSSEASWSDAAFVCDMSVPGAYKGVQDAVSHGVYAGIILAIFGAVALWFAWRIVKAIMRWLVASARAGTAVLQVWRRDP